MCRAGNLVCKPGRGRSAPFMQRVVHSLPHSYGHFDPHKGRMRRSSSWLVRCVPLSCSQDQEVTFAALEMWGHLCRVCWLSSVTVFAVLGTLDFWGERRECLRGEGESQECYAHGPDNIRLSSRGCECGDWRGGGWKIFVPHSVPEGHP